MCSQIRHPLNYSPTHVMVIQSRANIRLDANVAHAEEMEGEEDTFEGYPGHSVEALQSLNAEVQGNGLEKGRFDAGQGGNEACLDCSGLFLLSQANS